jgi:hypothetical protein
VKRPAGTSKQLVVEGYDDLFSVVGLMRAHIPWPQDATSAPVYIEIGKSADEILENDYLTTILKSRAIKELGIMLDADTKPNGRYSRIQQLLSSVFPGLPDKMPSSGLVIDNGTKRFGAWIMPDNSSDGYLEDFLRYLVPDQSEPLWKYATESVATAKSIGPCYRECHMSKANLYTWLAWQDEPGQTPGMALTKKILDPHSLSAAIFVEWFRKLYNL